jgi:hypothetical protein
METKNYKVDVYNIVVPRYIPPKIYNKPICVKIRDIYEGNKEIFHVDNFDALMYDIDYDINTEEQLDKFNKGEIERVYTYVDNYIFYDELTYIKYYKGRSSVAFYYTDKTKTFLAPIKLKQLAELMSKGINTTKIRGYFTFKKQGTEFELVHII